jgi:hypothetical protein
MAVSGVAVFRDGCLLPLWTPHAVRRCSSAQLAEMGQKWNKTWMVFQDFTKLSLLNAQLGSRPWPSRPCKGWPPAGHLYYRKNSYQFNLITKWTNFYNFGFSVPWCPHCPHRFPGPGCTPTVPVCPPPFVCLLFFRFLGLERSLTVSFILRLSP